MSLISPEYKALQTQMHDKERYGHSGEKWAITVAGLMHIYDCHSLLDYGCGTGRMAANLRKLAEDNFTWDERYLREYDPGVRGKDADPLSPDPSCQLSNRDAGDPFDLVTCIDVLEHIEPDCLGEVLAHLRRLTRTVLFTVISTRTAGKFLPDGRNAHLIVQPASWWHKKFSAPVTGSGFEFEAGWVHTADEWCALWKPRGKK